MDERSRIKEQIASAEIRWCLIRWRYPQYIRRNGWTGWMDRWMDSGQWRWWQTRSHPDRNLSAPMIQSMQQPQTAIMRPIMTQLNVVRVVCISLVSWVSFGNSLWVGLRRHCNFPYWFWPTLTTQNSETTENSSQTSSRWQIIL